MNSSSTRVIYFGTPDFAAQALEALIQNPNYCVPLIVTQPDRPAGRGGKLRASPVKELGHRHNIPILQPERIKKTKDVFLRECSAYGPFDIGVVCAFGQILPIEILDYPSAGCINIHASLLPRWRGAAPIQRAIMAGDTETGVSLMQMEAGLDTGPVYSELQCEISKHTTAGELHDTLALLGAELIVRDLADIASGSKHAAPQDNALTTYAEKISNEEAEISWNQSAENIRRLVHGISPFPGAFTHFEGKRLKIFKVSLHESNILPGTLHLDNDSKLIVGTSSGSLQIHELQIEGKRRMSTEEFLRGVSTPDGSLLGR